MCFIAGEKAKRRAAKKRAGAVIDLSEDEGAKKKPKVVKKKQVKKSPLVPKPRVHKKTTLPKKDAFLNDESSDDSGVYLCALVLGCFGCFTCGTFDAFFRAIPVVLSSSRRLRRSVNVNVLGSVVCILHL